MGGGPGARARRGRGGGEVRWSDLPGPALRLVMEHLARAGGAGGGGPAAEVAAGAEAEGRRVTQALYAMGRVCGAWHAEVRDYLMGDTAASRRKRKWVAARSGGGRHSSGAGLALCAEGRSNSEESESVGALRQGGAPLESGGLDSRSVDSPRPLGRDSPFQPPRQRARIGGRQPGRNGASSPRVSGGSIPTECGGAGPGVRRGSPGAECRGGGSSCGAQVVSGLGTTYVTLSSDPLGDSDDEVAWAGLEASPDSSMERWNRICEECANWDAETGDPTAGGVARAAGIPDGPPLEEADPNEARGGNRSGVLPPRPVSFRRLIRESLQVLRLRRKPPARSPTSSIPSTSGLD